MYIYTGKPTIHGAPQQKVLASQQFLTEICTVYSALKNYYTVHYMQKQIIWIDVAKC